MCILSGEKTGFSLSISTKLQMKLALIQIAEEGKFENKYKQA